MLAFAWRWGDPGPDDGRNLARRLGASLSSGIGGHCDTADLDGRCFAFRALAGARSVPPWRPAKFPDETVVAFAGYFDNAAVVARELDVPAQETSRLYGEALARWGEDADLRIIGEYAAILIRPDRSVRLSRSPLRGPPLHYFCDDQLVAAASTPRALFAAGVERRLNEDRLSNSAIVNFTDHEESWYRNVFRLPVGHVVDLEHGAPRRPRKYYDILSLPDVRPASDEECLQRVSDLLDEGVRACMRGFSRPGATLSSGLDSPQIAVRAMNLLPAKQKLPTFTFHPESEYDGVEEPATVGDERPIVEELARMHPRLEPHFTSNEGYGHDHRWNDFFHLMGSAPSGLCNMYLFHGLMDGAAAERCDVLLIGEWGNYGFSDKGDWGFVEYFLRGKWRQLWLAYKHQRHDDRPLLLRFVVRTLSAFLPLRLWQFARRHSGLAKHVGLLDLLQPLNERYRRESGAQARLERSGLDLERYQPRNRRDAQRLLFRTDDAEGSEIFQAFEEMYGVAIRDPTAYRPLIEYCYGLPVEFFMRDGTTRWLAKQLAKGIMPEKQRDNHLNGRWDSDWHLRLGRRRKEMLAELDRLESNERVARVVDIARMRASLEDWPDRTPVSQRDIMPRQMMVPRGLLTARFINYIEGSNQT